MNRILHLDCSPRLEGSESARLSRAIVDRLVRQHPGARVIGRPCGRARSPMWMATMPARWAPQGGRRPGARLAGRFRDLIRELESADCLVIGTPMHNYGALGAQGLDRPCGAREPDLHAHPHRQAGRAGGPPGICRGVVRRILRVRARAPARLPHAVPDRHPEHHRSAHDPFLFGPARGGRRHAGARGAGPRPSWSAISPLSTPEAGQLHLRQRQSDAGPRAAYRAGRHHPRRQPQ